MATATSSTRRASYTGKSTDQRRGSYTQDNPNNNSISGLDLSWLNESVIDAALDTKHLRLNDVEAFHSSLIAATDAGSMDQDVSERLHQKIESRKTNLMDKMVAHETARVTRRLGLHTVLKTFKMWKQVQFMADMHGQGAYITMSEFKGLEEKPIAEALGIFHAYLAQQQQQQQQQQTATSTGVIQLPYSNPGEAKNLDESVRPLIEEKVAIKFCQAYRRLYKNLMDNEIGGYKKAFLDEAVQYDPEELMGMLGVTPAGIAGMDESAQHVDPQQLEEEDDTAYIMGEKTDDEDEDDDDDEYASEVYAAK